MQLAGLISTMANDGVYVATRITAATIQAQSAPQTIAFHPVNERRVISSLTAAQMRQMMQGVVLHGTGTKAKLIGYSTAGKTGTAQKVDPATHAYSHTKYVASFGGFAPINDPAITVIVVLDSAVGLHQGGQVSAPVFTRIAQQVLEYLHTPHDIEIPASRQVLLARNKASDKDLEEGSPDHPGETIEAAEAASPEIATSSLGTASDGRDPSTSLRADARLYTTQNGQDSSASLKAGAIPPTINNAIVPAAMRARVPVPDQQASIPTPSQTVSTSPSLVTS